MRSIHTLVTASLVSLTAASAWAQPVSSAAFGSMAADGQAERTIPIRPDTRWVNVTRAETVRFVVGDGTALKTFTWRFDTLPSRPFSLNVIAPQRVHGGQQVAVYVTRNRIQDGR